MRGLQFKRTRLGFGNNDTNTTGRSSTGMNSNGGFSFTSINNNNQLLRSAETSRNTTSNEENTLNEHNNYNHGNNHDNHTTEGGSSTQDQREHNNNNDQHIDSGQASILREWKRSRGAGYRQVSSPTSMKDGSLASSAPTAFYNNNNAGGICVSQSQSITRLTQELQTTKRALTAQLAANLRLSEQLHKEKEEKKILSRGVMDQNHKVLSLQREKEHLAGQVNSAAGMVQGYEQVVARAAEHIATLEATVRQLKGIEEGGTEPYHYQDNFDGHGPPSVH
jgi:hypothetical protein